MSQTPGLLEVNRNGNEFRVLARGVSEFTLLLNPEEVNFSQAIQVYVNSGNIFDEIVAQDKQTLLHWASKDLDRSMLFTAELKLRTGE